MTDVAVRVPLTVRLKPDDKAFFTTLTERSGLEPSIAARQVLELVIQTMRSDGDFVITLNTLNAALRAAAAATQEARAA
jgi:hypothetical protein